MAKISTASKPRRRRTGTRWPRRYRQADIRPLLPYMAGWLAWQLALIAAEDN